MYGMKNWAFQPRVIVCSLCRMVCGDSAVVVSKDGLVCGVVVAVFVVETAYEFQLSGKVSSGGDSVQCLFRFVYFFTFDIFFYFFV